MKLESNRKLIKHTKRGKKMKYNYLIVGAGLFGAVFAHEAKKAGKSVLVIDKRPHIAGNIDTEEIDGIQVHKYGAHIFHTSNKRVWDYVQQFAEFNRYTNSPVARYKDELYNMPFVAAILGALFVGVGAGLCVRAGGAPGGDDAFAMSVCKVMSWDIRIAYLISDVSVLLISASYIDIKRLALSLLTVILSGQIVGIFQKKKAR